MKLVLIFLFFCFQSDQTGKLIFFRIDESIPMENISFGKNEIERWNRIIKVKSTSNIVFEFDYENRKHNFAVSKSSILKLNSISFVKQTEKTNLTLEIKRGHTIVNQNSPHEEKTNFKIKIECFGEVFNNDKLTTKSEQFNNDFNENPQFFF